VGSGNGRIAREGGGRAGGRAGTSQLSSQGRRRSAPASAPARAARHPPRFPLGPRAPRPLGFCSAPWASCCLFRSHAQRRSCAALVPVALASPLRAEAGVNSGHAVAGARAQAGEAAAAAGRRVGKRGQFSLATCRPRTASSEIRSRAASSSDGGPRRAGGFYCFPPFSATRLVGARVISPALATTTENPVTLFQKKKSGHSCHEPT
jgi:hypothetical protein